MTERIKWWDLAYFALIVTAAAISGYHLSIGLYAQALFTAGAGVAGILVVTTNWFGEKATVTSSQPALFESMPALGVPLAVRVVGAHGTCPLRFALGQTWSIDQQGQIQPALCRPAIAATSAAFAGLTPNAERQARCHCPWADARLTFAIEHANAA